MNSNNKIPQRVKEPIVRAVAFQVFFLAVAALYFKIPLLIYILLGDFFFRAFVTSKLSPLAWMARLIWGRVLPFREKMVMLRPKKFAAGIGFVLSAGALTFYYLANPIAMQILLGTLAFFSFLEWALRFCAGCKIFGLLIKLGLVKEDLCEDCVFPGGEGI